MKTENTKKEMFKVVKLVKLGLLYGYGVKNTVTNQITHEFDEKELYRAESKCELLNLTVGSL